MYACFLKYPYTHTHAYIYYIYRCAEILFCWYSFIFETHLFISPRATLRNPRGLLIAYARSLWSQHLATSDRQVRGFSWWFNGDLMGISWDISYIYDVHYNQQSDSFNPYFSFGMCLELGPRGLVFFPGLISHLHSLGGPTWTHLPAPSGPVLRWSPISTPSPWAPKTWSTSPCRLSR